MTNTYPITDQQKAILERFTCERLTANSENKKILSDFYAEKGGPLNGKLWNEAWREDLDGVTAAYYIIKDPKGRVALYFSLKCGILCDPDYVRNVMDRYDRKKDLMDAMNGQGEAEWAVDYLDQHRTDSGQLPSIKKFNIRSDYSDAKDDRKKLEKDIKSEPNEKIIRVDQAFSAIELVHFCANDHVRKDWKAMGMDYPMGQVLFWWFIVPKMVQIHELIGCEFVYLFAADRTPDGNLMNYYENTLHFDRVNHIGAIKPAYDFTCFFMCKRLSKLSPNRKFDLKPVMYENQDPLGLVDYREDFFEHFNRIPCDDMV